MSSASTRMPSPDPRRRLTVRLARAGAALRRSFAISPPMDADGAVDAGLDPLVGRLDGPPDDVASLLDGDAPAQIGGLLFRTLFADDTTFAAVLRAFFAQPDDPAPDPVTQPVRVRVVSADLGLLGLPWRLTAAAGARLADHGWTFEVTPETAFQPGTRTAWERSFVEARGTARPDRLIAAAPALRNVHLPAAGGGSRPRVLVIAPGVYRGVPLHTEPHVRDLRGKLAALGVAADDPEALRVTRTPRGVEQALGRWEPDLVYVYGDLDVSGGGARLVLAGPAGGAAPVSVADLATWMRAAPPAFVLLNTRSDDAAAWRSAVEALGPVVPLVVAGRTRAFPGEVRADAVVWITGWLAQGGDPVAAIHAAGATAGVPRATAVLCSSYERWTGEPARVPAAAMVARARSIEAQRAAVLRHAYALVRSRMRRVVALLAPAPPASAGVRPITDEIDLAGADFTPRTLRLPLPIDHEAPLAAFKEALFEGLDVTGSIGDALLLLAADARRAPGSAPDSARALVWLDWGAPPDGAVLSPRVLGAWLDLGADVLAPACPPEVRVISALTLPTGTTASGKLATWLSQRRDQGRGRIFDHALLPEAGQLERGDVRAFVDASRPDACSDALAAQAADLVFAEGGGDVDKTAALVARAQATSWAALVRELGGKGEPEAGEEDTAF